jgi:hypothetical protein
VVEAIRWIPSVHGQEVDMEQQASGPLGAGVAVTHILVAGHPARSRDFWVTVLGAELYREYGGTSVVLRFAGTWLLLVGGGARPPINLLWCSHRPAILTG